MLYCIRCEKNVLSNEPIVHYNTVLVTYSPNPGDRWDLVECNFEDGWATVPPPEFDMEQFMAGAEMELFVDIPGYDYDVERDEIVEVLL